MSENLVNTSDAARLMGVSKGLVQELCRTGKLSGATQTHPGGPWIIPQASIDKWNRDNKPATIREQLFGSIPVTMTIVGGVIAILTFIGYSTYCDLFPNVCSDATHVSSMESPESVIITSESREFLSEFPVNIRVIDRITSQPIEDATVFIVFAEGTVKRADSSSEGLLAFMVPNLMPQKSSRLSIVASGYDEIRDKEVLFDNYMREMIVTLDSRGDSKASSALKFEAENIIRTYR